MPPPSQDNLNQELDVNNSIPAGMSGAGMPGSGLSTSMAESGLPGAGAEQNALADIPSEDDDSGSDA